MNVNAKSIKYKNILYVPTQNESYISGYVISVLSECDTG